MDEVPEMVEVDDEPDDFYMMPLLLLLHKYIL